MRYMDRQLISAGLLTLSCGLAAPVNAQAAATTTQAADDNANSTFGDIVVTARRREESAQTVPVAVTALGSAALETRSVRALSDLTSATPGLRFAGEGNSNVSSISLRGLNKIAASSTGTPAVVVYFAEVPLPGEGLNLPTFDLANVQVLKGPQGTLFGRNTIGGAVLVTPEAPSTTRLGGYGRVSYGNLDYKAVEGAVNVPIIQDKVGLRVAGQLRRRDGFVQTNLGYKLQNVHQDAYRVSLVLQPTDALKNVTMFDHFKARDNGTADMVFRVNPGIFAAFGLDPAYAAQLDAIAAAQLASERGGKRYVVNSYVGSPGQGALYSPPLFTRIKTWGITNTTTFQLADNLTLKNIFGYRTNRLETRGNNDGLPALPGGFIFYKTLHSFNNDKQITNELQLQGSALDNKLTYILGGFYSDFSPNGRRGNMNATFNSAFTSSSYVHLQTKALFAQAGYDLGSVIEGLKLNAGVRYTWTKQSLCGITVNAVTDIDQFASESDCKTAANSGALGRGIIRSKEHKPTWTLGLDYKASDDLFFYVTSRRGYREGGINGPLFNSPAAIANGLERFQTYKPEIITDVEVGAKTDWRAGDVRGRFNVAAFRQWYKGVVNYINVTGSTIFPGDPSYPDRGSFGFNAAKETISGVEVETMLSPTPGMLFSGGVTYLKQKVDNVTTVAPFPAVQVTLPSPKWSFTLAADFTPQVKILGGDLTYHFDYYWLDNYQVQTGQFPGYRLANARVDLRDIANTGLSAGFFVKNVFNNHYLVSPVIALPQFPANIGNPGEPCTYGLELSYRF